MPTILVRPRNFDTHKRLKREVDLPFQALRRDLKSTCAPVLGYPEEAFLVNLAAPYSYTDPDSPTLAIVVTASDKQHHRDVSEAWADAIEEAVRNNEIFDWLINQGRITIFIPIGEGVFRVIE